VDDSRLRWQQQRKFAHPQWPIWNSALGILLSGIFMTISFLISNNLLFVYQQGGKDAASPLLISTSISKLTRLIFHPQGISALITDFKEFHKRNTVRFVITMTEQKMQQAEAEGFHKAFQLQTTHSLKPTLLYDSNGSLRMYGSANEVLKAFFEVRLGLYGKRKEYLTDLIQAQSKYLTNQSKFIREVCDNVYNFNFKEV
jgi:hypothetical protein